MVGTVLNWLKPSTALFGTKKSGLKKLFFTEDDDRLKYIDITTEGHISCLATYPKHQIAFFFDQNSENSKIFKYGPNEKIQPLAVTSAFTDPLDNHLKSDKKGRFLLVATDLAQITVIVVVGSTRLKKLSDYKFDVKGKLRDFEVLESASGDSHLLIMTDLAEFRSSPLHPKSLAIHQKSFEISQNLWLSTEEITSRTFAVSKNGKLVIFSTFDIINNYTSRLVLARIDKLGGLRKTSEFRFNQGEFDYSRVRELEGLCFETFVGSVPVCLAFEKRQNNRVFMFGCAGDRLRLIRTVVHFHSGEVRRACLFNRGVWSLDSEGLLRAIKLKF